MPFDKPQTKWRIFIVRITLTFLILGAEPVLAQDIQLMAILGADFHTSFVNSVAFAPDGRTLANGNGDNTIEVWDVQNRTLLATLKGHTGAVNSVAFSPDGRTLASGSEDRTIKFWDVQSRTLKITLEGHADAVTWVAFSPDGRTLASGSGDREKFWGGDNSVRLWDVESGTLKAILLGHTRRVASLAYSSDGSLLASASWDSTIKLWDAHDGTLKASLRSVPEGQAKSFGPMAFSPDGRTLAGGVAKFIQVWDVKSRMLKAQLHRDENGQWVVVWETALVYSPNGRTLISSGQVGGMGGGWIKLWDAQSGTLKASLEAHTDGITSLAISPDGSTLASGSWDKTIRLWRLGEPHAVFPQGKTLTTWGSMKR